MTSQSPNLNPNEHAFHLLKESTGCAGRLWRHLLCLWFVVLIECVISLALESVQLPTTCLAASHWAGDSVYMVWLGMYTANTVILHPKYMHCLGNISHKSMHEKMVYKFKRQQCFILSNSYSACVWCLLQKMKLWKRFRLQSFILT